MPSVISNPDRSFPAEGFSPPWLQRSGQVAIFEPPHRAPPRTFPNSFAAINYGVIKAERQC